MRKLPLVAGLFGLVALFAVVPVGFALIAGARTEKTDSVPPRCSASDTRNERTLRTKSFDWARYCGPARAVVRWDGKLFRIKHGTCHRGGGGVGFGLIGYGSAFPHGRGIWLRIQRGDHFGELIRPGRNSVVDGEVELPGYGSLPHTGSAIVWKHVKGGTFSLGDPAKPVTGRFYCG